MVVCCSETCEIILPGFSIQNWTLGRSGDEDTYISIQRYFRDGAYSNILRA